MGFPEGSGLQTAEKVLPRLAKSPFAAALLGKGLFEGLAKGLFAVPPARGPSPFAAQRPCLAEHSLAVCNQAASPGTSKSGGLSS
mmetsp:Transcript_146460/g.255430  ORF Transcript_146460/g.255430 Transcript_146460/m.255430 type:complete len:85 (+) Transcript_146460:828-1082(+)